MDTTALRSGTCLTTLILVLSILTIGAGAAAGAQEGLAAAVWPMLGGSSGHTSFSTFQGPATNQVAWRFDTNAGISGPAIDVDGSVFFGSDNGWFFALDQTGRERWSVKGLTPVVGVPALARGGKVYVATNGGTLYAFDIATGASLWSFHANSPITTSPAIGADGTVYFGTRSKGLIAVSPPGTARWAADLGKIEGSSPAVGPDATIYFGTADGKMVAVAADGSVRWQRALAAPGSSVGSPLLVGNRLYAGAADGFVRALDAASGNVLWAFQAGGTIGGGVSLGPDAVLYFGAADKKVYALHDAGDHAELRWAAPVGSRVSSTPAVDRTGAVYVGDDGGRVYALEAVNGTVRWSLATGQSIQSALAIGIGGRIFVGSDNHSFYAIGEFRSGADCWSNAFIDPTGLTQDEITRRVQILLAACGGPNVNACEASVQGGINADRFLAAQLIASQQISPAQYLAILRDRTRKLDALRASGKFCDVPGRDADGDLVPDVADQCPGTPPLTPTLDNGCPDPTLPPAPSADLMRDGFAKLNLLLDPRCDQTVPPLPAVTLTAVHFSGTNLTDPSEKEIWFAFDDNQAAGCGVFFEMEVFYRRPDGVLETYYLVFPRSRGVPQGSRTFAFTTKRTDAGLYGAFTKSGALVFINNPGGVTRYRLRATNYAGARSLWSPLICFECQPEQ